MLTVVEETAEQIRDMGVLGRLIENCVDCRTPTRFWANGGDFPLCEGCCSVRNDEQAALIARYNASPKVTRDLVRSILGMKTPKDRERDDAGEPWDSGNS